MTEYATVRIDLGARAYDIKVGAGLLHQAGRHVLPLLSQPRAMIVTDDHVAPLLLASLERSLNAEGIATSAIVLPAGEQTKDFAHLEVVTNRLLDSRIERGTSLIALGGGVIGDLTGFAASILLRGIDFIQIPTTLLAQVDSSVGGKTGINTRQGKNLVGSFYQPRLVLADIQALDTLPRREFLSGYAEVVKYGLIGDAPFFEWLETHGAQVLSGEAQALGQAVVTSCAAKAGVVASDERENGLRALLNFGHTFGHALEAETGFGAELLHGEAVAIGMMMAFDFSVRRGLCPAEDAERTRRHFRAMGLKAAIRDIGTDMPAKMSRAWSPDALLAHMSQDKKVRDGRITFVLTRGIGQAFLAHDVGMDDMRAFLAAAIL